MSDASLGVYARITGDASGLVGAGKEAAASIQGLRNVTRDMTGEAGKAERATSAHADSMAPRLVGAGKQAAASIQGLRNVTRDMTAEAGMAERATSAHADSMSRSSARARLMESALGRLSVATGGLSSELATGARAVVDLARAAGPLGIAAGIVAVGLGTLAARAIAYRQALSELNLSVAAHGNTLNISGAAYAKLAEEMSKVAGLSQSDALKFLSQMEGTFAQPDTLKQLFAALPGFAAATGKSIEEAMGDISKAFRSPKDAAEQLNREFGLLTAQEMQAMEPSKALALIIETQAARMQGAASGARTWTEAIADYFAKAAEITHAAETGQPYARPQPQPPPALPNSPLRRPIDARAQEEAERKAIEAAKDYEAVLAATADVERGYMQDRMRSIREETAAILERIQSNERVSESIRKGDEDIAAVFRQTDDAIESRFSQLPKTYEEASRAALDWRNKTIAALDETADGYDDKVAKIGQILGHDLAQAYDDDLRHRFDWRAGIERANRDILLSHRDMASQSERFLRGFAQTGEDAFAELARTGKFNVRSLTDFVLDQLARLAYQKYLAAGVNSFGNMVVNAFESYLGIGSAVSSSVEVTPQVFGSATVAHTGGTIGTDSLASRYVHPSYFEDAPRFHGGGIAGDEVPIVAKKGEGVFTPRQMDNANDILLAALSRPIVVGGSSAPKVTVNISTPEGTGARVNQRENANGDIDIEVMVEQVERKLADRARSGRNVFVQQLEGQFGLKRRV